MPFRLVLTKNGPSEEVSAVPQEWVTTQPDGSYLYWPRTLKKTEIESLRMDENSRPEKSWKKIKCKQKLNDICSFEEALRLEDLYSKFQDTEDEEKYINERSKKKHQHTNAMSRQLLDVNSVFDLDDTIKNKKSSEEIQKIPDKGNSNNMVTDANEVNLTDKDIATDPNEVKTNAPKNDIQQATDNNDQGTYTHNEEIFSISQSDLLKLIQENSSLQTENKSLKEQLLNSEKFQNETKKNFIVMQVQLDKIVELLLNKNQAHCSINGNFGQSTGDDGKDKINLGHIMFPIETKEQLDALENKLYEKDVFASVVKKFSTVCGTSGLTKISKIGIPLMKCLITDDLLNQFTWKGIKGSTKMAFVQYLKIRELFYKLAHLADKSCSFYDSDLFIQHSAIKHSGQRIKRRISSTENKKYSKKAKREINVIEIDTRKIDEEMPNEKENKEKEYNHEDLNEEKDSLITKQLQEFGDKNNNEPEDDNYGKFNAENPDDIKIGKQQGSQLEADKFENALNQSSTSIASLPFEVKMLEKEINERKLTEPSSSKVTILSDVKIHDKTEDFKDIKKMANISQVNLISVFDDLINLSP